MERLKNDIVSRIMGELEQEGRVTTLTQEQTHAIDIELAEAFKKIREESIIRERNAWIDIYKKEMEHRKPRTL
jgi:hypothetical protein